MLPKIARHLSRSADSDRLLSKLRRRLLRHMEFYRYGEMVLEQHGPVLRLPVDGSSMVQYGILRRKRLRVCQRIRMERC